MTRYWRKQLQEGMDMNDIPVWKVMSDIDFVHGSDPQAGFRACSNFMHSNSIPMLIKHTKQPGVLINVELQCENSPSSRYVPLVEAVCSENRLPLFQCLMKHPGIDVNKIDMVGSTQHSLFLFAVSLLLSRIASQFFGTAFLHK